MSQTRIYRTVGATRIVTRGMAGPAGPQGMPDAESLAAINDRLLRLDTGEMAICGFGDSITGRANFLNSASVRRDVHGFLTHLVHCTQARYRWDDAFNLGVEGNSTAQMAARLSELDGAVAAGARVLVFLGGTNDVTAKVATASITANYATILKYATQTLGMECFVLSVLPRSLWTGFTSAEIAAGKAKIRDLNSWLADYCAANRGLRFVDCYGSFADADDEPLGGMLADGLHPSTDGAIVIARALAAALRPYHGRGAWQFPASWKNLLVNAHLCGVGGVNNATNLTLTGAVPDSWTLSGATTGGTNSAQFSRNADGSLRVTFASSNGSASHSLRLSQSVNASGRYGASDVIAPYLDYRVVSASHLRHVCLLVNDVAAATKTYRGSFNNNTGDWTQAMGRGIQTTDRFQPGTTPASLEWQIDIRLDSAAKAAEVTLDIYAAGLFKLT